MSLMKKKLHPNELLESVIVPLSAMAQSKGLALDVSVADNVPDCFYSDHAKLTQVLNTLADQAVRRTCRGSVAISIFVSETDDSPDRSLITFSIEDTGQGVDPEAMARILDLNISMADWPREYSNSDTALAIRMASKLVSLLGGALRCDCRDGGPTRFYFSIECTKTENDVACADADNPLTGQPEKEIHRPAETQQPVVNVLVVDDVTENRMLVGVLLKKLGLKISNCANGREAFDLCQKERFDLVLMDIQMPVMNGLEAAKQIRAEGLNRNTAILAMTASNQKADELAAIEAGCDGCLEKPIDRAKLERKISRITSKISQLNTAEQGGQIVSFLQGDPDYHKAVEAFIANLPGRIEEMKQAFEKGDLKELAFKVHSLKGLGGFAGFPVFTEKAKLIEENIHQQDIKAIQAQIDEMVQLCLRTKLKTDS